MPTTSVDNEQSLDMDKRRRKGKPASTLETPTLNLRGENLEYYKNIEYLKEMTRQANALLDRSNAKYENILDDHKLGYKVRARSASDSSRSLMPELEGKCMKCGLAHGAANFCIVEQIMKDEKEIDDNKRRSKASRANWSFKSFVSVDSTKKPSPPQDTEETKVQEKEPGILEKLNILDKMTPSQVLDHYEAICFRYGPESGRKFLLVNSQEHPAKGEIQKWTTPRESHRPKMPALVEEPKTHYHEITQECESFETASDSPLCPDKSREVVQKMEQLVHVFPPCQTEPLDRGKKWKGVFKQENHKQDQPKPEEFGGGEQISFEKSVLEESCHCIVQTCTCHSSKKCTTPKIEKNCHVTDHEVERDNNYLLTMRRKIWKRRETKRKESQKESLKESVNDVSIHPSKSEEYLAGCRAEQYKTLKDCLSKKVTGYDEREFDEMVKLAAEKTANATPIDPMQFDHWNAQMKKQEEDDMEENYSVPSDIPTDDESSLISHQTAVDFKFNRIKPSRIPYAEDVYDLIDNLYEKIIRKFETSIRKNCFKKSRLIYRPTYDSLHAKFNIQAYRNLLFKDIMLKMNFPLYAKRLTPFHTRKRRKLKRLEALEKRLQRAERSRDMTRGLQLGKKYRKVSVSHKFTPESGYSGFRPQERRMLDPKKPNRFDTFNLIGDCRGKAITVKTIHHDYRLIGSMFDTAAKTQREDLMDEGMQTRLREFQKKLYNSNLPAPPVTDTDTDEERDFTYTKQKSTKEEMQFLQKANVTDPRHVTFAKSDENMQSHQRSRLTNFNRCKTSISDDKLKNLIPIKSKKGRGLKPQKSESNTDVKYKNRKDSWEMKQTKVGSSSKQKASSSARSLTNLLPPLNEPKSTSTTANSGVNHRELGMDQRQIPIIGSTDDKANKTRSSVLTKLPKLKTHVKPRPKSNRRKISDEALPSIKQRESVENLKPGNWQEKPSRKSLVRKMSVVDVNVDRSVTVDRKLPFLVDKAKLGHDGSESSSKTKQPARPRIMTPTVPKLSGFKAWR